MQLSLNLSLAAAPAALTEGSAPADPPPPAASFATLPVTPAGRWHADAAGVSVLAGRVDQAQGLEGPDVTAGAEGVGPLALSDALGRAFWRFEGQEYLDVGHGLTFSNRNMAVFAVVRVKKGKTPVFSIGNRTGYGAGSTAVTTGGAALDVSTSGQIAPFVRGFSRGAHLDAANGHNVIAGQQLQVIGMTARSTTAEGSRLFANTQMASVSRPSINATGVIGGEIGRRADAPGSSGSWSGMDLYELVVFDRALTDNEAQAVASALTSHWAIPQITDQFVLEGDSIMAGAGLTSGETPGRVVSEAGAALVPDGCRVISAAISGNRISHLIARRDITDGWASQLLSGTNTVVFEVGRNDFGSTPLPDFYADVVAYLNTPGTGLLQRGWDVRVMLNIASGSSFQADIDAVRGMLRNPQFLTDVQAGPGQTYDGRVRLVETDLIISGADGTIFADVADATDATYYQGDATHPSDAGLVLRVTGGDTPQHGLAHGLI